MQSRNWEDFQTFNDDGTLAVHGVSLNFDSLNPGTISAALGTIDATATSYPGSLSGTEEYDLVAFNLTAGQTYTFDYRGAPGGVVDPYLALFGPSFNYLTEDDDGGFGRGSMITYTPTVGGTYYVYLTSFYTIDSGDPSIDTGGYTLNVWSPEADVPGSTNVPASLLTAVDIDVGTYFGNLDSAGDNDYYAIDVTAGQVYTFNYSGGVWGGGDFNGEPGENLATISVYNAAGTPLSTNLNYESGTSYFAPTDGTIYVRVQGYQSTTGGYTLDVGQVDPATHDPLDAINWASANNVPYVMVDGVPTAYVYFAPASDGSFGETEATDDYPPGTPITTYGWQQYQIDGVMSALTEYTPITGIHYLQTTDLNQATFRLVTTTNDDYGARFYPQDPSSGSKQGLGIFNLASGGFGTDPAALQPGGFSYAVVLHEFGHAHGLAHPHDTGGGSEVMLGVTASTGSYGVYNLNQGVYTVMSYNDGWPLDPDGQRTYSAATRGSGWSETLGAFDIAALQDRYGQHANNTGDTVYTIADVQADSQYRTIWDTGGNDTIAYTGTRNAQIDLLAATLDYTPTGGGVVSFAHGVWGGFTIANGVVIENATGGSGNDVLLGNSADNVLTGNAGNDALMGREGNDTASYANAAGGVTVDLAAGTATGADGSDTLNSMENVVGSAFADTLIGTADANTLNGGNGLDTVSYANAASGVTVNLSAGTANGGGGSDTLISIENAIGSAFDDTFVGNGGANAFNGGAGTDLVSYANATGGVTVNLATGAVTGAAGLDTLNSIENVIGSNFQDRIIGDAGVNTIGSGNGIDVVTLGGANDVFVAEQGTKESTKTGSWSWDVITDFDASGDDLIDLTGIGVTLHWDGTNANKDAGDLTYKVYNSITGAENALGIDIDGQPGANSVSGPVTIVYGNTDGGSSDFAVVLLNTSGVDANDFIFAHTTTGTAFAAGSTSINHQADYFFV